MALTLTIAPPYGDGTCHLQIRGGAVPGGTVYQSNFTAGVDGWVAGTKDAGVAAAPSLGFAFASLKIGGTTGVPVPFSSPVQYAEKALALTPGTKYLITLVLQGDRQSEAIVLAPTMVSSTVGEYGPGPVVACTLNSQTVQWTITAAAGASSIRILRQGGYAKGAYVVSAKVQVTTADLQPLTMTRTDANGSHPVRLPANAAVDSSGALDVTDSEPALTGEVTYLVRDAAGYTATATTASLPPGTRIYSGPAGVLLTSVGLTTVLPVELLEAYSDSRQYQQLTIDPKAVIGRQDFTAVILDDYGWSNRQGRLTFRLRTETAWDATEAVADLYTRGRVVLLRQTEYDGMDLYHVGKIVSREHVLAQPSGHWIWTMTVDYIEVGFPAGELVGVESWTWAKLPGAYPYWYNVTAAFPSWNALRTGVP